MTQRTRSANLGGTVITSTGVVLASGLDVSSQANAAYLQANTARSDANATFATVNTAVTNAHNQANAATTIGQNAYGQANLAYAAANNSNLLSGGLVSGTINVTQDLIVGGNIYLEGNTTYINVSTYLIEDSLVYYASNNKLTDSVDIGFMGGKNTSGTYSHTGLARDATDAKWKLFDGLADEGHIGNVVDFANTYLATLVANVEANTLTVVNGVSGNVNFDSGTLFVDSVNDRIGIKTFSPAVELHANGVIRSTQIQMPNVSGSYSSGTAGFHLFGFSDNNLYFNWFDNGAIVFRNNGTNERLRITAAGDVGIGTTSPDSILEVSGDQPTYTVTSTNPLSTTAGTEKIADMDFVGQNNNLYRTTARIRARQNGTWSTVTANLAPTALEFYTQDANTTDAMASPRLIIDSSGNVGIGTASPFTTLDVNGYFTTGVRNTTNISLISGTHYFGSSPSDLIRNNIVGNINADSPTPVRLRFYKSRGTSASPTAVSSGDLTNDIQTWAYDGSSYIQATAITAVITANSSTNNVSSALAFVTNGGSSSPSERMRITSGGNVGIGVDPGAANIRLYVKGANQTAGQYTIAAQDSSGNNLFLVENNGNVGIGGLANASAKVNVLGTLPTSGTNTNVFWAAGTIPSGTTGDATVFRSNPSTAAASFTASSLTHFWANQGTIGAGSAVTSQYGFLAPAGLTGATNNYGFFGNIATAANRWNCYMAGTAPNYFAGDVGIGRTPAASTRLTIKGQNNGTGTYSVYVENATPTEMFKIRDDGVFYTGLAGNSPYNLTTGSAANVFVDSDGALRRSTSSLRYKSDVVNATHGLADVLKLRSVTYKGKNDGDKTFGGLIAEEVHDAGLTEFVAYDIEGRPDALHYGNMVALLVRAIQELKNENDALKARIETLETK